MKYQTYLKVLLTAALMGCGGNGDNTDNNPDPQEPQVRFKTIGSAGTHALPNNGNAFSGVLTSPGGVIEIDGLYYLFYSDNVGGWPPSDIRIGYATSSDMRSWERNPEVSLSGEHVPYLNGSTEHPSARSVVKNASGGLMLYFDIFTLGGGSGVGLATAPGVDGPWEVHSEPVLAPEPGQWDEHGITANSVLRADDEYRMYYAVMLGPEGNPEMAIGMAQSSDGITWTKHPEPVFTKGDEAAWDFYKVEVPNVIKTAGGWVMAYRSDKGDPSWGLDSGYGIATSSDGITWTRFQPFPVVHEAHQADWANIWAAAFFKTEKGYYLIVENDGRGSVNRTRVAVTFYDGDFF